MAGAEVSWWSVPSKMSAVSPSLLILAPNYLMVYRIFCSMLRHKIDSEYTERFVNEIFYSIILTYL